MPGIPPAPSHEPSIVTALPEPSGATVHLLTNDDSSSRSTSAPSDSSEDVPVAVELGGGLRVDSLR